ncbi:hypothetical protein Ctha_0411 [Chloroherpeton thalassium ATCC 35110]|uniref:Protein BatD n=1 Tax=Chloroherpeton thalassium (strain ATCC 35110 / GB-78) TaxID=517418 RepID=B3QUH6_CHLT3|nr:hypothetical protein [Chloroherpeton thalassium]ACF12882.1 hypothetical protein Ctha_0411 [Chloroherpeton thalassium ATCC 35110]
MMKSLINKIWALLLYGLLVALPQVSAAAEPSVSVEVSTDTCTIGDNIFYTLRVLHEPSVSVAYPTEADTIFAPFEIRKLERHSETNAERVQDDLHYTLTIFETGLHYVPPIILRYIEDQPGAAEGKLQVPAKPVFVRSVLDSTQKSIADIKPVQTPDLPAWIYAAVIAGIALVALIAYLIYKAKNRQTPATTSKPKPQKPPYDEAMEKLSALKQYPFETEVHYRNYYTDLSDALRVFLERFYQIPAQEQLTAEIHSAMLKAQLREQAENAKLILEKADLVKFAKYYPSKLEAGESLQLAIKVVEVAKPTVQQAPASMEDAETKS